MRDILDDYVQMSVQAVERARREQLDAMYREIEEHRKQGRYQVLAMVGVASVMAYVLVGWWLL